MAFDVEKEAEIISKLAHASAEGMDLLEARVRMAFTRAIAETERRVEEERKGSHLCVYCGEAIEHGDREAIDAVMDHVVDCDRHPIHFLYAFREALDECLVGWDERRRNRERKG